MIQISCPKCGHEPAAAMGPAVEGERRSWGGLVRRATYRAPMKCPECGLRWVEEVPKGFDPAV